MLFNASKKTINAQQQILAQQASRLEAINRSMAVIEFDLNGIVLVANENFLKTMGYRSEQVLGQPHRQFCLPDFARSSEYQAFWQRLKSSQRLFGNCYALFCGFDCRLQFFNRHRFLLG